MIIFCMNNIDDYDPEKGLPYYSSETLELKKALERCSSETLKLAEEAVERQRMMSNSDTAKAIDKLVEDTTKAGD